MTKESYFYNSAKLIFSATVLLLFSNLCLLLKEVSPWFTENCKILYDKLPMLSFIIFTVLAFVAINGEGIAHRRARNIKYRKNCSRLKFFILLNIVFIFTKTSLVNATLKTNPQSPGGALIRIGTSIITVIISYSFFLLLILIMYRFRDRSQRKLAVAENFAIGVSAFYELFRIINFSICDYGVDFFGGVISKFFSSTVLMNVICIIQYAFVAVSLFLIMKYYSAASAFADEKMRSEAKSTVSASMIYSDNGFGIDTQDDDWVLVEELPETEEILTE